MPRQIAKKLIFLVFLINLVVASPVLFGRDEVGGDSFWGLDLEDVVGAGAAGLEALSKLWDFSTAPGVSTIPSEAPPKEPDEGSLETPDPVEFPLFESTKMIICPVAAGESEGDQIDRLAVEQNRWQVEQEPETGRPVISACDVPKDKINDAYIVREIRFEEGKLRARWPAAILVSDPVKNIHFRYNVIRVGTPIKYKYQKITNAVFMRQGKVLKLGYVRRWGWLVGAGQQQPKEVALKWFEDEVMGTTSVPEENIGKMPTLHYTAGWIAKVFAKAAQSGSPYWIADQI